MLDRGHSGSHGALDPFRTMRVSRHFQAPHRRLGHHRVQLLLAVLRSSRRFRLRQNPRGSNHLDEVGTLLHADAHRLPDLVHPIGESRELSEVQIGGEADEVRMTAGRTDPQCRDLHPGADGESGVDRLAERHIRELSRSHLTNRGEAGGERALGIDMCPNGMVYRTQPKEFLVVVSGIAMDEVGVAVDQPRQDGGRPEVH